MTIKQLKHLYDSDILMYGSKIHNLKLHLDYVDDVFDGVKTFEYRFNDRKFMVGDYVRFFAFCNGSFCKHNIVKKLYLITYILPVNENYVVFSFKEVIKYV